MVEVVVAGCDDVAAPPTFDPFIGINFPTCMIEDGVDGHNHEERERSADMYRNEKRQYGEEPSGTYGFDRIK